MDNLTDRQIGDKYSGRITAWNELGGTDGKIYPVNRELGDSSRSILNKNISDFKEIEKAAAKTFYTTPETVEALVRHKGTIGYSPLSAVTKTALKIMKINGVYPSVKNIGNGKYKLTTPFAIVYKGELSPLAKAFTDFIFSSEGQRIIKEYGGVPARR